MSNAILTRIVPKFQITVPTEIRELFGLEVGDLFQWEFDAESSKLQLIPKRAQLITPLTESAIVKSRTRRKEAEASETAPKAAAARAR
ncbi:MAG: AbrB/MazE/SpoVT family DNA-binding domain-containing protein [Candidatus Sulfotelmatobacter sp.]